MPRNLNGRVEVMFPVGDPHLVGVLREEVLGRLPRGQHEVAA
jgi:polyphosphate kinase